MLNNITITLQKEHMKKAKSWQRFHGH